MREKRFYVTLPELLFIRNNVRQIAATKEAIMKKSVYFLMSCLLGILLNACAFDLVHIKQIPTQMDSTNLSKPSFELEREVNVDPSQGYKRKLKQGTKWNYVGTVSYGDVFTSKDQILTVEASNIHEAYIVISSGKLVGF